MLAVAQEPKNIRVLGLTTKFQSFGDFLSYKTMTFVYRKDRRSAAAISGGILRKLGFGFYDNPMNDLSDNDLGQK